MVSSDFAVIVHRLPGRSIKVYAIGDVHIGAAECDLDGFERFLKQIEREPDSYIVLVGDIINNGVRSASCPTNIYDETMPPSAQIDKAVELLRPVAHKILGFVGGNHELRTTKAVDIDPAHTIAALLGIPHLYRKNMAFVRIVLGEHGMRDHYALLLVHGKSEAARRRFEYTAEGVDAIVSGHVHKGNVSKPARIVLSARNIVSIKPLVSLVATSWTNYGGYAARGLMQPAATSDPQALLLEFAGTNNRDGQIRVIW